MILSPSVKSSLLTAIFTVILFVIANAISSYFNFPFLSSSSTNKSQPFTVQGTGTASAKPDQAQISFSVTKTAPTLQDAQNQANTATNSIVADIKTLGISSNDIKTNNYNSYPNYDNGNGTTVQPLILRPNTNSQTIISYTVNQDIAVTVRDNNKVNTVIDTATKDNAENISGPNYIFSDSLQHSLEDKARTQAITDAKQKAQSIAAAAGVRLGRITNIQENNQGLPILMMGSKAVAPATGGGSVPTNINPGENTVTDTVTLSYETY